MKKLFIFLMSALILLVGATSVIATAINITPAVAYNNDALTCAVDPNPGAYTYKWFYNGNYVKIGPTLESSYTEPSQTLTCKVYFPTTPWTGEIFIGEASRTISQSTPTVPALTISSGPYYANSVITATALGSTDPEGNSITYEYQFTRGGAVISNSNTLNCLGLVSKGQLISVSARAFNGNSYSDWQTSAFTISNSNPYNLNIVYTPTTVYTNSTIAVTASASDIDGDALAYVFRFENLNDSLILQDYSALSSYTFNTSSLNDTVRISARASDGTAAVINFVDVVVYDAGGTGTSGTGTNVTFQYCSTGSTTSPISLKEVKKTNIEGESFYPLEKITIKAKVENTDDEYDHDAIVEAVLIHDENELSDTEVDISINVNNDDTESVELELEIPSDAEVGSYYLMVKAYNDDNENNCQEVRIPLSVKRKTNDIILHEVSLPETILSDSEFSVNGEIANIGNEDEEKVQVVYSDDTGNSYSQTIENLDIGDLDAFSFLMNIPLNATLGAHTAKITVYFEYDEDDDTYDSEDSTEYSFNILERTETIQATALGTDAISAQEQKVSTVSTSIKTAIKEKGLVLLISLIDAILVIYAITLIIKKF